MKKVWFTVISTFAISFGFLAVPLRAQFAYVANTNNTVSGYSIDRKTGALTPILGSPFATGSFATSARFAYVANEGNNTVSGYSIDRKTGALTPVPGSPFAGVSEPFSIAVDPTAQFAYVANLGNNTVSGYSIDRKTGALTPVPVVRPSQRGMEPFA
jgi:6-phosphogluconolactonase